MGGRGQRGRPNRSEIPNNYVFLASMSPTLPTTFLRVGAVCANLCAGHLAPCGEEAVAERAADGTSARTRGTMTRTAALQPEPAPIVACTISRDVQNFDLLIEDMETECGESWGDLTFQDGRLPAAIRGRHAGVRRGRHGRRGRRQDRNLIAEMIKTAIQRGIKVILIAEDVSPPPCTSFCGSARRNSCPTPCPTARCTTRSSACARPPSARPRPTFPPRVCLLDLDLQFGSVSTYLDLPRTRKVYELLSNTAMMDRDFFQQALQTFNEKLQVLTARGHAAARPDHARRRRADHRMARRISTSS
jgi:hypothetical protein